MQFENVVTKVLQNCFPEHVVESNFVDLEQTPDRLQSSREYTPLVGVGVLALVGVA